MCSLSIKLPACQFLPWSGYPVLKKVYNASKLRLTSSQRKRQGTIKPQCDRAGDSKHHLLETPIKGREIIIKSLVSFCSEQQRIVFCVWWGGSFYSVRMHAWDVCVCVCVRVWCRVCAYVWGGAQCVGRCAVRGVRGGVGKWGSPPPKKKTRLTKKSE